MLIVSDIHFGANREEDVNSFLKDVVNPRVNPEKQLIIVGDITQNATHQEFQKAEQLIQQLIDQEVKLVFTPGNHDFGDWKGEIIKTNTKARSWCKTLLKPIFEQDEVIAINDFDSILQFDDSIFVVLRSTHRGESIKLGLAGNNRIRLKQIEWASSQLLKINRENKKVHLVTHRSLWSESGDMHSGMIKRRRLEEQLFEPFNFHSFIHGHNHRFVYAQTSTPKLAIPIIRLGIPTLSKRNKNWQAGYVKWETPLDKPPELIGRQSKK